MCFFFFNKEFFLIMLITILWNLGSSLFICFFNKYKKEYLFYTFLLIFLSLGFYGFYIHFFLQQGAVDAVFFLKSELDFNNIQLQFLFLEKNLLLSQREDVLANIATLQAQNFNFFNAFCCLGLITAGLVMFFVVKDTFKKVNPPEIQTSLEQSIFGNQSAILSLNESLGKITDKLNVIDSRIARLMAENETLLKGFDRVLETTCFITDKVSLVSGQTDLLLLGFRLDAQFVYKGNFYSFGALPNQVFIREATNTMIEAASTGGGFL